MVQFRGMGGAVDRVSSEATAFSQRGKPLFVAVLGIWMDPDDDPARHRSWAEAVWNELKPSANGVYVNFLEDEGDARKLEAYGPVTFARLAEVKRRYDPTNMFPFNQNIRPAR